MIGLGKEAWQCLDDYWLVGDRRLKNRLVFTLTDCMAGGFPPCLAGRRLVGWFGQRGLALIIGWWETVDSKIDLSLLID